MQYLHLMQRNENVEFHEHFHRMFCTKHLYTGHCAQNSVHKSLYTEHYTQVIVHRTLHKEHCTQNVVHRSLYTKHWCIVILPFTHWNLAFRTTLTKWPASPIETLHLGPLWQTDQLYSLKPCNWITFTNWKLVFGTIVIIWLPLPI